jgi:glycosyltransferase involved in cell wall biosynthesis
MALKKEILRRAKKMNSLGSSNSIILAQEEIIDINSVEILFSHKSRTVESMRDSDKCAFIVSTIFEDVKFYKETLRSIFKLHKCGVPVFYIIKEASVVPKARELVIAAIEEEHIHLDDLTILYWRETDNGMYEGLRRAFEFIRANHKCGNSIMTYINGDDTLDPLSVQASLYITGKCNARWITGTPQVIDETGELLFKSNLLFDQINLKNGLHVGRQYPFVQQEGTFWTLSLYNEVQGFDENFKLAGDYDLWLQFSKIEPLVSTGKPNASFRKRSGQKSENLTAYMDETAQIRNKHALYSNSNSLSLKTESNFPSDLPPIHSGFMVSLLLKESIGSYYVEDNRFKPLFKSVNHDPLFSYPISISTLESRYQSVPLIHSALDHERYEKNHGVPKLALHPDCHSFSIYYFLKNNSSYRFLFSLSEFRLAIIRFRIVVVGAHSDSRLSILCNGRERCYELDLEPGSNHFALKDIYQDYIFCEYVGPNTVVSAKIEGCAWAYLSINRYCTPLPSDFGFYGDVEKTLNGWPYFIGDASVLSEGSDDLTLPKISVIVPTYNQSETLRDTLASIFNQRYPKIQVILLDGYSNDGTREIVSDFLCVLSECILTPDGGQSEAIASGLALAKGDVITWLNSDDLFFPYCLWTAAMSYAESRAEVLVGNCFVFKRGEYSYIHSPNVSSGIVNPSEILDIHNYWLEGKYFHQPEVFFTKSAIEKVENMTSEPFINASLFYSMDFDIWAKMAISKCRLKRINATFAIYRMSEAQKTSSVDNYLPELAAHSSFLSEKFSINISNNQARRLSSWGDLHVLLFNDVGFFGGAGVAHERIANSLAIYGVRVTCMSVSDHWSDDGHSLNIDQLRHKITNLSPHVIICGNIHGLFCDHSLLLSALCECAPTCFIAHDFWIANGINPYPSMDPFDPLGSLRFVSHRWVAKINQLSNLFIIPNSAYCNGALQGSGLVNLVSDSEFVLCDGSISRYRAKQLAMHPKRKRQSKIKLLIGSVGLLSDKRKGAHVFLKALNCLPPRVLASISVGSYGFSPLEGVSGYCDYLHHGYIESILMPKLVSDYDVFVSMSLIETFGQTGLEAIGLGKTVVITQSGGHGEYAIDGTNAIVVPPTPCALADALKYIVDCHLNSTWEDVMRLQPLGRSLSVARFSHESQGFSLLRFFDKLLGDALPVGGLRIATHVPKVINKIISDYL